MAAPVAFAACLVRLGFNQDTCAFFVAQGVDTLESLSMLPITEITELIKSAGAWRSRIPVVPPAVAPDIQFPWVSIKKLKALREWAGYKRSRGEVPMAGAFNEARCAAWLLRLNDVGVILTANETPPPLPTLESFNDWVSWEESLKSTAGLMYSSETHAKYLYLMREESVVPATALALQYDTIEEDLIATTQHLGPTYKRDNERFHSTIKIAIGKGPGYPFIHPFNRTKNGRGRTLQSRHRPKEPRPKRSVSK